MERPHMQPAGSRHPHRAAPGTPGGDQAKEVETAVEEMLIRLDEFCGLTDVIRRDTSQILDEHIPLIKAKVTEMNGIYTKVDKLEAFVKMVGHHVSFLEAQVLRAEKDHGTFPRAVRKWLQLASFPPFRNKPSPPTQPTYELPTLYRTEDYFPMNYGGPRRRALALNVKSSVLPGPRVQPGRALTSGRLGNSD
ncbi:breast carcinoma-amplified sequence 4 [Tachyglossus aculeatus]|uniref:breast carcinoma-amplified sequence 4 n=1 Tax=Tachyglossus aculeatus TaxID=9261 RepID=UPI0018F5320B|nr:breast carcinoma-amplified sequence 4 [Tachyglossus aculeatus]